MDDLILISLIASGVVGFLISTFLLIYWHSHVSSLMGLRLRIGVLTRGMNELNASLLKLEERVTDVEFEIKLPPTGPGDGGLNPSLPRSGSLTFVPSRKKKNERERK